MTVSDRLCGWRVSLLVCVAASLFGVLDARSQAPAAGIQARSVEEAQTPSAGSQTPAPKPQTPAAVSDKVFVESGDTRLYVEIRGLKKSAPVVLFLHEGPGNPVGVLAFQAYPGVELEKTFIVAYLDQRGVLRSPGVPDSTQTIANCVRDLDNVVDYLRKRFAKERISLIGHSWGGVLGYLYLLGHGDKIDKMVAVCAPFNVAESQFASYEMTLQWARDSNNQEAVADLLRLGSPPYKTSQELLTKTLWSAEAYGGLMKNIDMKRVMETGGFSDYDPAWGDKQLQIGDALYREIVKINLENDVSKIATPLLLIGARGDAEVPYFSLKRGFARWGGKKEFLVLDHSNHIPFVDETEKFVAEVTRFLGR